MGFIVKNADGTCSYGSVDEAGMQYEPVPCPSASTTTPAPATAQPTSPGMLESLYNSVVDFFSSDTSTPTPTTQPAPQPTPAPASGKDEYVCSPSPVKKCQD